MKSLLAATLKASVQTLSEVGAQDQQRYKNNIFSNQFGILGLLETFTFTLYT